jgi:uncharacterized membrane protein YgcG
VFVFVLAFSVGAALTGLLGWHVFLISTGQTTIEFYINRARRERARMRGVLYANPYDLGSCKRNWGQVFGQGLPWYRAVLPSTRPPPRQRRRRGRGGSFDGYGYGYGGGGGGGGSSSGSGGVARGSIEEAEDDDVGAFLSRSGEGRDGLLLRVV